MTVVSISRIHYPVTTLGPGKRLGVWFQGCSIRCLGCISSDTWPERRGQISAAALLEHLARWSQVAEGLTVTGGEPLEQPQALTELINHWRAVSSSDILLFTGFEFEIALSKLPSLPRLVDAVISGPFDRASGQTLALRGSDNQKLHIFTPAGEKFRQFERPLADTDKRLDVMFDDDGAVWFAGIPARDDFAKVRQVLKRAGHRVEMSDNTSEVEL
jgi:anaerobic ribonucleoside-triphosphate reductase activating protein